MAETSQYLHSIPMEYYYNQPNMLFPPNYDLHVDGYMDTLIGIEEALLADSPQQETPPAGGEEEDTHQYFNKLLLAGAEAVESENWHLASATLARLDQNILITDTDTDASPFLRLAYFFAQGLRLRALGPRLQQPLNSPAPAADSMSPYQMVQELSPYVKFAHFTANQAILEATGAGDREVHVVDFDVMEGLQWPPLMVDLARRNDAAVVSLRITAVVTESSADTREREEVHRTGRRLVEFADSIGLMLRFDHLHESDLDELKFSRGSVIANCVVHQLQMPSKSFTSARRFIDNVRRRLSPKMVVLVQEELFSATATSVSFVEFFCEALRHFSSVSDSLSSGFGGGYKRGLRLVEKEMLGPRIVDYVSHFPFPFPFPFPFGGSLGLEEGFRLVPFSPCNVSQAKLLVGLFSRGYGVQHLKQRLTLCWKSRPLTTASIWVPN